jgi:xanthine dehydrogenase accessory factor
MKELLNISAALQDLDGKPCALATVIDVEGSSYRRPGARMLLSPDGRSWGMISGGCLEHDVMDHARRALESGQARTVRYDSTSADDIVFGTGLGCNGIIDVYIEPVTPGFRRLFVRAIESCNQTRARGGIATLMSREGGIVRSWEHAFLTGSGNWIGGGARIPELDDIITGTDVEPFTAALPDGSVFVQPLLPPIHLVVFGGWLDVVPLIRIAKEVGFRVTVVDARRRISSPALFHEADAVLLCSPSEAMSRLKLDHRTAAVLMAHHFESDQEALEALARAQASPFYVGMLGPRRRQEKILGALAAEQVVIPDKFAVNLCGPAGLDLGATSPETIALAIVAEIQAKHAGRPGGMLNQRKGRIESGTIPQSMNPGEASPSLLGGPS